MIVNDNNQRTMNNVQVSDRTTPLSFFTQEIRGHLAISDIVTNNGGMQYFTVPHLFLQESGHSSGIPVESTGIHRNSSGILQESSHSSGIPVE